jgi:hypothetical protein
VRYSILVPSTSKEFLAHENSPWSNFFAEMSRQGFNHVSLDQRPDLVIFNNVSWKNILRVLSPKIEKKVLIIWESAITSPLNHKIRFRKHFNLILIPTEYWRLTKDEIAFVWPQASEDPVSKRQKVRKDRIVLIARNKISLAKGENYSLRRKIIFKSSLPLDVYGYDWNRSRRESFSLMIKSILIQLCSCSRINIKGARYAFLKAQKSVSIAEDKIDRLSDYKYSLVIENSSDYVSEKIVDALIAGCIPIYIGPPLQEFGFPPTIALACEPNLEAILDSFALLQSDELKCQRILDAGSTFMRSKKFKQQFSNSRVLKGLASTIIGKLK